MDALLIATGFTGALTLVWLARWAAARFHPPPSVSASFAPDAIRAEAIVREIAAARREVVLSARTLRSRPVAQALVEAKLRGVAVHLLLDPACEQPGESELAFLLDQGLAPLPGDRGRTPGDVILLDGHTVLLLSDFARENETANGCLVVIRQYPETARTFADDHAARKGASRPTDPAGQPPAPSLLDAVARGEDEEHGIEVPAGVPMVTLAAAELIARLRQQAAEEKETPADKAA